MIWKVRCCKHVVAVVVYEVQMALSIDRVSIVEVSVFVSENVNLLVKHSR